MFVAPHNLMHRAALESRTFIVQVVAYILEAQMETLFLKHVELHQRIFIMDKCVVNVVRIGQIRIHEPK